MREKVHLLLSTVALVLGWGLEAPAAEIRISYPAVENMLRQTLLTQNGRYYLQGDPESPCQYAYLEKPRVDAAEGRVRVTFHFSGRAAAEIAGRCVGPSEAVDVRLSGVPASAGGEVFLSDVRVEATGRYAGLLRSFLESEARQRLRYPLQQEIDRAANQMGVPGVRVIVQDLRVLSLTPEVDTLRVSFDFKLNVSP